MGMKSLSNGYGVSFFFFNFFLFDTEFLMQLMKFWKWMVVIVIQHL